MAEAPKGLLGQLLKDNKTPWIPAEARGEGRVIRNRKCSHGTDSTIEKIEIISTLPSNIFDPLIEELDEDECFMLVYKDKIKKWYEDITPCRGLCFHFIIRGIAYHHKGNYYCEQCYRTLIV